LAGLPDRKCIGERQDGLTRLADEIIDRLNAAAVETLADPTARSRL
jgi:hypothetical protein